MMRNQKILYQAYKEKKESGYKRRRYFCNITTGRLLCFWQIKDSGQEAIFIT